eukprot:11833697-Alexandrium_andersonii.AAC.1
MILARAGRTQSRGQGATADRAGRHPGVPHQGHTCSTIKQAATVEALHMHAGHHTSCARSSTPTHTCTGRHAKPHTPTCTPARLRAAHPRVQTHGQAPRKHRPAGAGRGPQRTPWPPKGQDVPGPPTSSPHGHEQEPVPSPLGNGWHPHRGRLAGPG